MRRPQLSPRALDALLAAGLFALTLLLLVLLSRAIGMGAHEQRLMAAARGVGQFIDRAAQEGSSVFGQRVRDQLLGPLHGSMQLPAVLSGAIWRVAAHKHTWLTETMALRSGFLLFNALSVPLLYLLVLPRWGRFAAAASCALFLLVPRSLHVLATASGDAVALTAWLLVAAVYLRSLRGGSLGWTLAAGFTIGLGLALSTSVVWLCALLLVHALWARRSELREAAREGTVVVPSALLAALVLAPVVFLLLTPWLWHETGVRVRQLFTSSLGPSLLPTVYGGVLVTGPPLPRGFALRSVLLSLPTITLVLAGVGAALLAHRWRVARRESSLADPSATGALLIILAGFAVLWPAVSPHMLSVYPPRWVLAMPAAGALAGLGLHQCVSMLTELLHGSGPRLRALSAAGAVTLALAPPFIQSVRSPWTLAAAFAPLTGGASSVIESRTLPVHDASMAARLAPSIDGIGRASVSIWSPEVPAEVWELLRKSGKLKTTVRAASTARDADLLVLSSGAGGDALLRALWVRNNAPPQLLGLVERDGQLLLALYRVK